MGGRDVSQDHCSPEGPTPWAEPRPSPAPADRSPESGGRPRARPPSRRRPVHVRGCRRQVRAAAPRAAPVRGGRSRASRPCPLEGAGRTGTCGRRGGSEATAGPWGLPGRRRGRAPDRPFVRRGARPPRPGGCPTLPGLRARPAPQTPGAASELPAAEGAGSRLPVPMPLFCVTQPVLPSRAFLWQPQKCSPHAAPRRPAGMDVRFPGARRAGPGLLPLLTPPVVLPGRGGLGEGGCQGNGRSAASLFT